MNRARSGLLPRGPKCTSLVTGTRHRRHKRGRGRHGPGRSVRLLLRQNHRSSHRLRYNRLSRRLRQIATSAIPTSAMLPTTHAATAGQRDSRQNRSSQQHPVHRDIPSENLQYPDNRPVRRRIQPPAKVEVGRDVRALRDTRQGRFDRLNLVTYVSSGQAGNARVRAIAASFRSSCAALIERAHGNANRVN